MSSFVGPHSVSQQLLRIFTESVLCMLARACICALVMLNLTRSEIRLPAHLECDNVAVPTCLQQRNLLPKVRTFLVLMQDLDSDRLTPRAHGLEHLSQTAGWQMSLTLTGFQILSPSDCAQRNATA